MKREDAAVLVSNSLKKNEIVHITKIKSIARLWAGMGEIFELIFYVNNNKKNQMSIICKEISIPSGADKSLSCGDLRKKTDVKGTSKIRPFSQLPYLYILS